MELQTPHLPLLLDTRHQFVTSISTRANGKVSSLYPTCLPAKGFLVVATRVRLNEFNHEELACDVARDFRVAYRDVEALYGQAAMRRIPLFGVGHSLGAKVHVLLNCYPEVAEVAKRRKVRDTVRYKLWALYFTCICCFACVILSEVLRLRLLGLVRQFNECALTSCACNPGLTPCSSCPSSVVAVLVIDLLLTLLPRARTFHIFGCLKRRT